MDIDINTETTRLIEHEIRESKIPLPAVADKSGIAYATLRRRLAGGGSWTATEIFAIASAIRIPPGRLLPSQLTEGAAA